MYHLIYQPPLKKMAICKCPMNKSMHIVVYFLKYIVFMTVKVTLKCIAC